MLNQILLSRSSQGDEMGGVHSTYGRDEKGMQTFGLKT
jgi:hypothetical protein